MICARITIALAEVVVFMDPLKRDNLSCTGEDKSLCVEVYACTQVAGAKRSFRQAICAFLKSTKARDIWPFDLHARFPSTWGGFGYIPVHSIIALASATSLAACTPAQPSPAEIHAADMIRRGYVEWAVRCAWADGHERRPLTSALRRCQMDLGLRQCAQAGGACQHD